MSCFSSIGSLRRLSVIAALVIAPSVSLTEIASIGRLNTAAIAARSYDGTSTPYGITPNGRYVVFTSEASNIVSGDTNGAEDVFLMDRGVTPPSTTRVSVSTAGAQANGVSLGAVVSDDGRYVVFYSTATNLVANDTNAAADVFLHDSHTHQTSRISVDENGSQLNLTSDSAAISGNGRYACFRTAAVVLSDATGVSQVYVRDLQGGPGALVRASAIDGDGANTGGNGAAGYPTFNFDGSKVAFESGATNLIAGGTAGGVTHIYVRNLIPPSRQTLLASRQSGGVGAVGNASSFLPMLDSAGTRLSFVSQASNLVVGDVGGLRDAFMRDLTAETTTRVGVASDGTAPNSGILGATISPDGNFVAFFSSASNLVNGDSNGVDDVFLRDLNGGATGRISLSSSGAQIVGAGWLQLRAVTDDASEVLFYSADKSIVADDTSDPANYQIFVRNVAGGTTSRVTETLARFEAEGSSGSPSISADCNLITFTSDAPNIVSAPRTSNLRIYVRNRSAATTNLVTSGISATAPNNDCVQPAISGNGRYVAFQSAASNLVAGDANGVADIFVYDLQQPNMKRISADPAGGDSDGASETPSLSLTGRFIGFNSQATNLLPVFSTDPGNAYVYDQQTGETSLVSADAEGSPGNARSYTPMVSSDGLYAVFASNATNLVDGDTNGSKDLFLKHRAGDLSIIRLSVKTGGAQIETGITGPFSISPDGRYVAFESTDSAIVTSDTNGSSDIFLHDRNTGSTTCITKAASGNPANAGSYAPSFTPDGLFVTFESYATDLVAEDTNNKNDAFVYTIASGAIERVSMTTGLSQANDDCETAVACNNRAFIAFASYATNLVANDLNGQPDVFLATYDFCPADPEKSEPGVCGCGVADVDGDGDGTLNCQDSCPADQAKVALGICGCGVSDADGDGDGTADCQDSCPNDAAKLAAGVCGCGFADTDSDGDGTANCMDSCPADAGKIAVGSCGCGVSDTDANANGEPDCRDPATTLVPSKPVVKVNTKKKYVDVTMQGGFSRVSYQLTLTQRKPKKRKIRKTSRTNVLRLRSLARGTYDIAYKIAAGSAVTASSKARRVTIK